MVLALRQQIIAPAPFDEAWLFVLPPENVKVRPREKLIGALAVADKDCHARAFFYYAADGGRRRLDDR